MRLTDRGLSVRAVPLALLAVAILTPAASAQIGGGSVIPPQISGFLCSNYEAIKNITPLVALLVFAATLLFGMVQKHASLVKDLIVGGLIAIVILTLPAILAGVGLVTTCL
jgi:hypothetical protein